MREALSWIMYSLGDFACRILYLFNNYECWVNIWHPVYNSLMNVSVKIQGDGNGPWSNEKFPDEAEDAS